MESKNRKEKKTITFCKLLFIYEHTHTHTPDGGDDAMAVHYTYFVHEIHKLKGKRTSVMTNKKCIQQTIICVCAYNKLREESQLTTLNTTFIEC